MALKCVPGFQIDFGWFCIDFSAKIVEMLYLLHKIHVFIKYRENRSRSIRNISMDQSHNLVKSKYPKCHFYVYNTHDNREANLEFIFTSFKMIRYLKLILYRLELYSRRLDQRDERINLIHFWYFTFGSVLF